jgi:hypothetical protein
MIKYFPNNKNKFVLSNASEITLFELECHNEDFIYEDALKPQVLSTI